MSVSGESVVLSNGATIYDQVDFGIQTQDISYARCPDGGTFTFADPTFDALNNCALGLTELLSSAVNVYPNPGNANFTIQTDASGVYAVYDLSGREITHGTLENSITVLEAQTWQYGTYLLRIQDKLGNVQTIQLIKN